MNFMRMPTEMFDEILDRVGPRIAKQHTFWRAPLDPGMKLAITLRHLASGTKYRNMQFGRRISYFPWHTYFYANYVKICLQAFAPMNS